MAKFIYSKTPFIFSVIPATVIFFLSSTISRMAPQIRHHLRSLASWSMNQYMEVPLRSARSLQHSYSISLAVWTGTIRVKISGSLAIGHTHGPEVTFLGLSWNGEPNTSGGIWSEKPNGNMKYLD